MSKASLLNLLLCLATKSLEQFYVGNIWNVDFGNVSVTEFRVDYADDAAEHEMNQSEQKFYLRRYNLVNVEES